MERGAEERRDRTAAGATGTSVAVWAAVTASALVALGVVAVWVAALRHRFQISYVEGFLLEQAARLPSGAFYRPLGEPAWIVDNFPPLYPALLALVGAGSGTSGAWVAGRLLTMLAVVALAVVLWREAEPRQGRAAAVAVAAAWLVLPFVLRRSVLVRMDFLALLLVVSGVLAHRSGRRGWALAAFLAAGLTRQTMVAAPLALALSMPRREAVRFLAALAGLAAVAVALLSLVWPDFLLHAVVYNTGRYDPLLALRQYGRFLGFHAPLLAVAAWSWWRLRGSDDATDRFLVRYAPVAAVLALTVGKPGSTMNHFLEALFAAAWLVARAPPWSVRGWTPSAPTRATMLVVAQAALLLTTAPLGDTLDDLGADAADADAALVARLAAAPAPVLSENAGAVVQAGHEVLLEPRTLLELHLAGRWDDARLVAALENATYSVVVTEGFDGGPDAYRQEGFRFSPEAWAALQESYEREQVLGRWTVWVPGPESGQRT